MLGNTCYFIILKEQSGLPDWRPVSKKTDLSHIDDQPAVGKLIMADKPAIEFLSAAED